MPTKNVKNQLLEIEKKTNNHHLIVERQLWNCRFEKEVKMRVLLISPPTISAVKRIIGLTSPPS